MRYWLVTILLGKAAASVIWWDGSDSAATILLCAMLLGLVSESGLQKRNPVSPSDPR